MNFSAGDMAKYAPIQRRADSVVNRVRQVMDAVKAKDQSAVDEAPEVGQVKIHEDCVTYRRARNGLSESITNPPPNFITSDVEACLSNGRLPIRIKGDDQIAGFKGCQAELSFDPSSGRVSRATVIGTQLLKPAGFSGPHTYAYERNDNREIMTIDTGGYKECAVVNADGTIAQFSVG